MKRPVKIGNAIDGVVAMLKVENARRKKKWLERDKAGKGKVLVKAIGTKESMR